VVGPRRRTHIDCVGMVFAERGGVIVIGLHRDVRAATTSSERVKDQRNNKVFG